MIKHLFFIIALSCPVLAFSQDTQPRTGIPDTSYSSRKHIPMAQHVATTDPIHIYLTGDARVADHFKTTRPEMGWGTRMTDFFDSTVVIVNKAQNLKRTKVSEQETVWKSIIDTIRQGDYVLIQAVNLEDGLNDDNYSIGETVKFRMQKMIAEAKKKQAIPVLVTPVASRRVQSGKGVATRIKYREMITTLARKHHVQIIDLTTESRKLFEQFGPDDSRYLFNYLQPGQNPNYPNGSSDDIHLNEFGARKVAQLVLADLRKLFPDLNNRVVKSSWGK